MASEKEPHVNDGMMLGIHLDVGHSSIGWAVSEMTLPVVFRGCGTVLFAPNGCLASERRANRRQRRHIRTTRQRISRMRLLLLHLGVLTEAELARPGCGWPWKLAAEVLSSERILTWRELWDVLRWYAHNRGYDGNVPWQRQTEPSAEDDKEIRESAHQLMECHKTKTMAETVCAVMGLEPGGRKRASMIRYKASKASFPRLVVATELERILQVHKGKLPGIDDAFIRVITGSAGADANAWQAVRCPSIKLPKRYAGGLLFGQLVPRFDNRIIGSCPISGEKKPAKSCPEFLEYRWAMQLANVRVMRDGPAELTARERKAVTQILRKEGFFTKTSFTKAVREVSSCSESNIDDMMLLPDAENALVLYPAVREMRRKDIAPVWEVLPQDIQRRVLRRLGRGKRLTLGEIRAYLPDTTLFDQRLKEHMSKGKKKLGDPLGVVLQAEFPLGRAPYSRSVMLQAVAEVMEGKDPRMEGGVLYRASLVKNLSEDAIDRETNNHLVRNRLRILRRLVEDIIREYAGGDKSLIASITIELNREVKDLSGKTAKQIASDLGLRLKNHSDAVDYAAEALGLPRHKLGGSLIRKVRVAMDLEWTCPYTKEKYDIYQLRDGTVDLDHIIPRSQRTSDSLDSLVVTFKEVNAWKSNMTAFDFVCTNGGIPVPGKPNLSIISRQHYEEFVGQLKRKRFPHADDQRRRDNRCRRMLTRFSDGSSGKGFTPRDLTVSSHLTILATAVLRDVFSGQESEPAIRSIPGRITKEVRMGFDIMGALAKVNPEVLDADGRLKTKTEIREVTHLHHAVDAITLGLAGTLIPADGSVWAMMLKRNLYPDERQKLEKTGVFQFDASGRAQLRALDKETLESIERCLGECRVANHIPVTKRGAKLEKTIWGILSEQDGMVMLRQRARDEKTGDVHVKIRKERADKLLGITPRGSSKLQAIKGAIIVSDNYGVALDPQPEVIPWHQVWRRIAEIKKKNNGVMPRILRKGMLIRVPKGKCAGTWRIFSVKANQNGIALDMGVPDAVKLENGVPRHKINKLLKSLLKDGLELCQAGYTGVVCHVAPSD